MSAQPQFQNYIAIVLCLGLLAACNNSAPPAIIAEAPARATAPGLVSAHIATVMLANLEQELQLTDSFETDLLLENSTPKQDTQNVRHNPKESRLIKWDSSGWREMKGVTWEFIDSPPETRPTRRRTRHFFNRYAALKGGCLETSAFKTVFANFKVHPGSCLSFHEWSEHSVQSTLCFQDRTDPGQNWSLKLRVDDSGACVESLAAGFEGKKQ